MKCLLIAFLITGLAGCSNAPRKPASLDGAPRVPVNKTVPAATSATHSTTQGE